MTPDRRAFIRRIIDEPDEDTHRLVFADWLDENTDDHAYAAFIRSQVAGAVANELGPVWELTPPKGVYATRFSHLVRAKPWDCEAVMTLLAGERPESGYVQATNSTSAVLWRRGFIEAILCSGVSLGPLLSELADHPIREVRLTNNLTGRTVLRINPRFSDSLYESVYRSITSCMQETRDIDPNPPKLLSLLRIVFPGLTRVAYDFRRPGWSRCPFQCVCVSHTADACILANGDSTTISWEIKEQ